MRRWANYGKRLSESGHSELHRLVSEGEAAVSCSTKSVQRFMARTGGIKPRVCERSPLRLSLTEREELSRGLLMGDSLRQIAVQ